MRHACQSAGQKRRVRLSGIEDAVEGMASAFRESGSTGRHVPQLRGWEPFLEYFGGRPERSADRCMADSSVAEVSRRCCENLSLVFKIIWSNNTWLSATERVLSLPLRSLNSEEFEFAVTMYEEPHQWYKS